MGRPNRSSRFRRLYIAGLAIVAVAGLTAADDSPPEDEVILMNGDRITGKIKGMSQGQLLLDTDHLGTLSIPWVHIREITGTEVFEVESEADGRYVGSISPSKQKGKVLIVDGDKTTEMDKDQIVRIVPIKKRFWGRIDGALSLGYSYTKSSDVSQLSFNGGASYRSRRHMTDVTLDTSVTVQEVEDTTSRVSLVGAHTRFLEHDWLIQADATFGQNQELGFDAQILLGGGAGRFLKRTNRNWLKVVGGLDGNRQWPTGNYPLATNLEANASLDYSLFRYNNNDNYFRSRLTIYTGLTDWGRLRGEWSLVLQQTLAGSLVWSFSGYYSYDSDPPNPTASDNDWGVVTGLGWSF